MFFFFLTVERHKTLRLLSCLLVNSQKGEEWVRDENGLVRFMWKTSGLSISRLLQTLDVAVWLCLFRALRGMLVKKAVQTLPVSLKLAQQPAPAYISYWGETLFLPSGSGSMLISWYSWMNSAFRANQMHTDMVFYQQLSYLFHEHKPLSMNGINYTFTWSCTIDFSFHYRKTV